MSLRQEKSFKIISACSSWADFQAQLSKLDNKEKGDVFEDLVAGYLKTESHYATIVSQVWIASQAPQDIIKELNLPQTDKGIDLIAKTRSGEFWAIQCKYKTDSSQSLTHTELSTFSSLTFQVCKGISFALVCSSTERVTDLYKDSGKISFCAYDVWSGISAELFSKIADSFSGVIKPTKPASARKHQSDAIESAIEYFEKGKAVRGKLIMPCGTGKSLTAWFIAGAINARNIVIALPSLSLVKQTLGTWTKESIANGISLDWACICSDETVAGEEIRVNVQDLGVPCFTEEDRIRTWLKKGESGIKLTLTTYQSAHKFAKISRELGVVFDLIVFDEAHKTVGAKGKSFSHLIFEENISAKRRIFMTATERYYAGDNDEILSMDSEEAYGKTFYSLTFKQAIESNPPILCDYRVLTIGVSRQEIRELISRNKQLKAEGSIKNSIEIEAEMLAALIALRKSINELSINHAVSFHSSIARSVTFKRHFESLSDSAGINSKVKTYTVSGETPTGVRAKIISEFAAADCALITNARCLTEGVDVPNIDCVLFADPKQSKIDIVQASGRALRAHPGKTIGYIILPVLHEENSSSFDICNSTAFLEIVKTLRALASSDERIVEEFHDAFTGNRQSSNSRISFVFNNDDAININLDDFSADIKLRCWDRIKHLSGRYRINYRDFNSARDFARSLQIRTRNEWRLFCMGLRDDLPTLPSDISKTPWDDYNGLGWSGIDDWLGTSIVQMLSYDDAKKFVHSLGLRNWTMWELYVGGKYKHLPRIPLSIPKRPNQYYHPRKAGGWIGLSDWLGFDVNAQGPVMEFKAARDFARSLKLKSTPEWLRYRNGERPDLPPIPMGIPDKPELTYKNAGWVNYSDWLGLTEFIPAAVKPAPIYVKFNEIQVSTESGETKTYVLDDNGFLAYNDAREIVVTYNFRGKASFYDFMQRNVDVPPFNGIPCRPQSYYHGKGWAGWPNWLRNRK